MPEAYQVNEIVNAIAAASKVLSSRRDEINRLNVFPVPDGDTGTNMSLTLEMVVDNLSKLPIGSTPADYRKAITTGALMGARGNSGVITSQILRGLCEGFAEAGSDEMNAITLDAAFRKAVEVAFLAVRKAVEGTILTVLRDSAKAAHNAAVSDAPINEALKLIVEEAYASVNRTPDLLPVLKENNVVDAGGFGLAIFFDAFSSAIMGLEQELTDQFKTVRQEPKVEIENINDWEGSHYRYCNEFLVDSDTLDKNEALDFLATMGDCELCVGENPKFKVHVHSNTPDKVLRYFLDRGQIFEVHIHNMQIQSQQRVEGLEAEERAEHKAMGVVAVAPGSGNADILRSLGVDVVVSGGQTMNPSTKDLVDAVKQANADSVVILPDNSNIIMAAQSCTEVSDIPCAVVPTVSVPQGFSAMFGFSPEATLEENVESMTDAFEDVKTGEVTTAIKDAKDAHGNPIKEGDVIGIIDGSIESVGTSVEDVTMDILNKMEAEDCDNITLLAGEDYDDEHFEALTKRVEDAFDDAEVDPHRGEQPLYPVVLSVE
jgi:DAK2 domain fusion protein YloV